MKYSFLHTKKHWKPYSSYDQLAFNSIQLAIVTLCYVTMAIFFFKLKDINYPLLLWLLNKWDNAGIIS